MKTLIGYTSSPQKHSDDFETRMSKLKKRWGYTWRPQPTPIEPPPIADPGPLNEEELNVDATTVSHLEDSTVGDEDYVVSLQPNIYKTSEFSTEVPYSHHPVLNLHDDVEYVIDGGFTKYGIWDSSHVLDTSLFFCTPRVCENVSESFLYLKMISQWFQRQNIQMMANGVSSLLDWVEKPPPFPPDITHDVILYQTLQATGDDDHVLKLLRFAKFSVVLCAKECIPAPRTKAVLSFLWLLSVCAQMSITCVANEHIYKTKVPLVKFQKLAESSHFMDSVGHCTCQCAMVYVAQGQRMHAFFARGPLQFLVFIITNSKAEGIKSTIINHLHMVQYHQSIKRFTNSMTTSLCSTLNAIVLLFSWRYNDCHLSRSNGVIKRHSLCALPFSLCLRATLFCQDARRNCKTMLIISHLGYDKAGFIGTRLGMHCMCEDYMTSFTYWSSNFRHGWELGPWSIDTIIVYMINAMILLWFSREMALQEIFLNLEGDKDIIKVSPNGAAQFVCVLYCESLEFLKGIQRLVNTGVGMLTMTLDFSLSHCSSLQGNVLVFYSYLPKGARSSQHVVMETKMNNWWDFPWEAELVLLCGFFIKPVTISIYFRWSLELETRVKLVVVLRNSKHGIMRCLFQLLYIWILRDFRDMKEDSTLLVLGSSYKCSHANTGQHNGSKAVHPYPSSLWTLCAYYLHKLHNDKVFSTIMMQLDLLHNILSVCLWVIWRPSKLSLCHLASTIGCGCGCGSLYLKIFS